MNALQERLKKEEKNLIDLCIEFDSEDRVSSKIEDISKMLNAYLEDEELFPKTVREITYSMTILITFLARLGESVSYMDRIKTGTSH